MFIEISKTLKCFLFVVAILFAPASVFADFDKDPYADTEETKNEGREKDKGYAKETEKEKEKEEEEDDDDGEEVETDWVRWLEPGSGGLNDPAYPKIPVQWNCEVVSEKGDASTKSDSKQNRIPSKHGAKPQGRSVHYGLSVGYTWYWFHHLLNLTPMLEIRLFKPENSRFKTRDVVLRVGLRMDLMPRVENETKTKSQMLLILGPEAGVRMYWPGEKRSPAARLFHGPSIAFQYERYESRIEGEVDNSYHTAWLRVGYELGVMLFRHLQLSARVELCRFFFPNFGFSAALVY